MIRKWIFGGIVFALLLGMTGVTSAQEKKMTREEYDAQLLDSQTRETNANAEIEKTDLQIADLKGKIKATEDAIKALQGDIRGLVDASEAEMRVYGNTLDGLLKQLEGLSSLTPEELFHQRGELADVSAQLAELKGSKMATLPKMAAKIARIEGMLADLEANKPQQITVNYEVMRGDNLWNIAKKDEIYADAYMWPRLYRANKEKISDPDLIYPKQNLDVPFGVGENQYLVTRGDVLSKIAAAVYNDPGKWQQIYEANKDQIVEQNLIFPAQVLEIPAN